MVPPLFHCVYVGATGVGFEGPYHATAESHGIGLSATVLSCVLPSAFKLAEITGGAVSGGANATLNVSVLFGQPPDFIELPYGMPGGNAIAVGNAISYG